MFVRTDAGWTFGGTTSGALPADDTGAYRAELCAATLASKMAFDTAKIQHLVHHIQPDLHFAFDSITVGKQLEGAWSAHCAAGHNHFNRSVVKLTETSFGVQHHYHFTPGHAEDPGNELVDVLANQAAQGHTLHEWPSFFQHVLRPDFVRAMEWTWMLQDPVWTETICRHHVVLPERPTTAPTVDDLMLPTQIFPQADHEGLLCMKVATGNVLTAKAQSDADFGAGTPSRLATLLRQFDEARIHVMGLQEMRITTDRKIFDSNYVILHAPATEKGHFGVALGLRKKLPFGKDSEGRDLFLTEQDVQVVRSHPRCLIVRVTTPLLKCLILVLHAPHTGAPLSDIEEYWDSVARCLLPQYSDWPVVILADANSKTGDETSAAVGQQNAETTNPKRRPFHDFVLQHHAWLPATIPDTHPSDVGGTWQHTGGTWSRIDYVGLPPTMAVCCMPILGC